MLGDAGESEGSSLLDRWVKLLKAVNESAESAGMEKTTAATDVAVTATTTTETEETAIATVSESQKNTGLTSMGLPKPKGYWKSCLKALATCVAPTTTI